MKRMKRIAGCLLALAMLLNCAPFAPLTAEAATIIDSGTCGLYGKNLTWILDNAGTLTISGAGYMEDYSSSTSVPWYYNISSVKNVIIEDRVLSIGDRAFDECTNLTSVKIGKSVVSIGYYAFDGAENLASVYITDISAWCAIDFEVQTSNPLWHAKKLYVNDMLVERLDIPKGVTSIKNHAFLGCTNLKNVNIPDSVTSIGNFAFSGCTSLTNVNIPNSATSIGDMAFSNCISLASIDIPNSVTYIGHSLFSGCTSLISFDIPDLVTNIKWGMFSGCTSLTSVDIPDLVTSIGSWTFHNCTNLTKVNIPDSVTIIDEKAFFGCTSLMSVNIPSAVTSIGNVAFGDCSSLTEIYFKGSAPTIGWNAFYNVRAAAFYYADESWASAITSDYYGWITWIDRSTYQIIASGTCGENLKWVLDNNCTLTISGTGAMVDYDCTNNPEYSSAPWYNHKRIIHHVVIEEGVTSVGEGAFCGCFCLKSVSIPETITYSGPAAFYNCIRLEKVIISDLAAWFDISFVTFADGHASAPWSNPLRYADYLYANGTPVVDLVVPESVTHIKEGAFIFYSALESVTIPDSVTYIENGAFYNCENLKSINIGSSVVTIEPYALLLNDALEQISVDSTNSYYMSEDDVLFNKEQTKLVLYPEGKKGDTYNIPSSVSHVEEYAFWGCINLAHIDIPNSVTIIGEAAFMYCSGLTGVTIPDSVSTIENYAFYGCTGLKEIYFDGYAPVFGERVFDNVTATAFYYPNNTWTEEVRQNYGGNITWVARECTHSYASVITPATCTEQGYTTHTCSVCGDSYKDTYTNATGHSFGEDNVCDSCGYIYGDVTGDGVIDADDVSYLLWYTVFPEDHPLKGNGDFNGDGTVTDADVILLLLYVSMPDLFPLMPES